jgi:hypothetical protein
MNLPPTNGNGKTAWWLISLLTALLLTAVGTAVSSLTGQLHALTLAAVQNGERIAVIESEMREREHRLDRMERKLDQVLEHQPHKP